MDCNATAPNFGVQINGTVFTINPEDMILNQIFGGEVCATGVSISAVDDGGFNILGEVFLKNVVAIFDVGAGEMRFVAREEH